MNRDVTTWMFSHDDLVLDVGVAFTKGVPGRLETLAMAAPRNIVEDNSPR